MPNRSRWRKVFSFQRGRHHQNSNSLDEIRARYDIRPGGFDLYLLTSHFPTPSTSIPPAYSSEPTLPPPPYHLRSI